MARPASKRRWPSKATGWCQWCGGRGREAGWCLSSIVEPATAQVQAAPAMADCRRRATFWPRPILSFEDNAFRLAIEQWEVAVVHCAGGVIGAGIRPTESAAAG